jgi:hypothetical protein
MLSDQDGFPLFEHLLNEEEIKNGGKFTVNTQDNFFVNLTMINQYQFDSLNLGTPFWNAITYCQIDTFFSITDIEHPHIYDFKRPLFIKVTGVHDVTDVIYFHGQDSYFHWSEKKSELRIQLNHDPGEDIFIQLISNQEDQPRYIYISGDKQQSDLNYQWSDLPADLLEVDLILPEKQKWVGTVTSTNTSTNSVCYFQHVWRGDHHISELPLAIPLSQNFKGFDIELFYTGDLYTDNGNFNYSSIKYVLKDNEALTIPALDINQFKIYNSNFHPEKFTFTASDYPDLYVIYFLEFEFPGMGSTIDLYKSSPISWQVMGLNTGNVSVTFPKISPQFQKYFYALSKERKSWITWGINLIKFFNTDLNSSKWMTSIGNLDYVSVSIPVEN